MRRVHSVNVSAVKSVEYNGAHITTGIFKTPVTGRVSVGGVNVAGDDQADRTVHGGPERVIYAYAQEDYAWWGSQLDRPLDPGTFGENVTTEGVDVSDALIGERWRVGNCTLQVTSPRVPCYKLAMVMNDPVFVRTFSRALRPGAYLAIVEPGDVAACDPIEILSRPAHGLTVAGMADIYLFQRSRIGEFLDVPELPESWRDWVESEARRPT